MISPWITIAATLASQGLPKLAERLKDKPMEVVKEVAVALGTSPSPKEIEVAIASDPEALEKLATIEIKYFDAEEESRQAARDAWVGTWFLKFAAGFSMFVLVMFAASLGITAFTKIPPENADFFVRTVSTLENILMIIVGFIFGSSVGSKMKPQIQDGKS